MIETSPDGGGWVAPGFEPALLAVIGLAVLGTTVLFCCGVVAYSRRRSPRYLLVAVVLGLLVVRSVVGLGTVVGAVPMTVHHLVGHGCDVSIAALVLYAVVRNASGRAPSGVEDD